MTGKPGLPVVLAITGASGAAYAVRLLEQLLLQSTPVWLIVSGHGFRLLETESGISSVSELRQAVDAQAFDSCVTVFDDSDRGAAPASGSALCAGMVVCPCSMGTVSAIAHGTSRSLIERAADVMLKERRPLLLLTRETPLSLIHLENMTQVTRAGATVFPASPGFYHQPESVSDLIDFMVARIMDHLRISHTLGKRWGESS